MPVTRVPAGRDRGGQHRVVLEMVGPLVDVAGVVAGGPVAVEVDGQTGVVPDTFWRPTRRCWSSPSRRPCQPRPRLWAMTLPPGRVRRPGSDRCRLTGPRGPLPSSNRPEGSVPIQLPRIRTSSSVARHRRRTGRSRPAIGGDHVARPRLRPPRCPAPRTGFLPTSMPGPTLPNGSVPERSVPIRLPWRSMALAGRIEGTPGSAVGGDHVDLGRCPAPDIDVERPRRGHAAEVVARRDGAGRRRCRCGYPPPCSSWVLLVEAPPAVAGQDAVPDVTSGWTE